MNMPESREGEKSRRTKREGVVMKEAEQEGDWEGLNCISDREELTSYSTNQNLEQLCVLGVDML